MSADDLEVPFVRPSSGDRSHAAPGRPAQVKFAALYQGEFETPWDGTAAAVRAHARALSGAGIPVLLKSFSNTVTDEHGVQQPVHQIGLPESVDQEVGALTRTRPQQTFPRILHLVVRNAEHLKQVIIPRGVVPYGDPKDPGSLERAQGMRKHMYDSTIVYSVWERDRVDPAIALQLSRVAECWVPSYNNRQMLIDSGVPAEKVVVMPHPYDPDSDILKLRRRSVRPFRSFYSIGRWEPRKAYAELIEAFLRAFRPSDAATLTIKYTGGKWPGYPTPEEVKYWCVHEPELTARGWTEEAFEQRVTLIEGRLPRAAIVKLHFENNIYVSSSRGEAWCLPAFEAKLAGNRLLTTFTGAQEFAFDGDSVMRLSVAACPAPVPASYNWEADARWLGFSTADLQLLLATCKPPTSHAGSDMSMFSIETIGARMRERVLKVAEGHPHVLADWGIT